MPKRPSDPLETMPLPRGTLLYSQRFLEALEVAAVMFAATRRKKTSIPYVAHLLGVCAIVLEHGGSEDEAIAALLHDTLEDITPTKRARRTVRAFGDDVYGIVLGCTDGTPDRQGKKAPWRERREAYVAGLEHEPRPVLLVAAADKLHNARAIVADLRTIGEKVWKRFNAPKEDVLWYYGTLVEAFRANPAHPVAPPQPSRSRWVSAVTSVATKAASYPWLAPAIGTSENGTQVRPSDSVSAQRRAR